MKNNFKIFLFIIFFFPISFSYSDEFKFSANEIEVLDNGDKINASGNVEILTKDNFKMKSDKALIDKINSIIRAYGNVKIDDKAKDIEIETNSVLFDKKEFY